jgi:hypothetical protein
MFKNGMRPVHPGEILLEDYIKPMGVRSRDHPTRCAKCSHGQCRAGTRQECAPPSLAYKPTDRTGIRPPFTSHPFDARIALAHEG